jgi:hypothetical protein
MHKMRASRNEAVQLHGRCDDVPSGVATVLVSAVLVVQEVRAVSQSGTFTPGCAAAACSGAPDVRVVVVCRLSTAPIRHRR